MRNVLSQRSTSKRAAILAAAVLCIGLVVTFVGPAAADSPDPSSTISGSVVDNPDNTHTLTISGGWVWSRACGERTVGWEADWNDPNQIGNIVGTVNGVTTDVGAATANSLNPADNLIDVTPQTCNSIATGSSGTWGPLSHRYAASVTSAAVCIVVYDVIDGQLTGNHSRIAGGPNHNVDNSVEKNFNQTHNGCFTTTFHFLGSITIVENAEPNDAQDFSFAGTGGLGGFSLDDDGDAALPNTRSFNALPAGNYAVTQAAVSGWTLSSIVCVDASGGTTTSGATANIGLAEGESVTCTFTNVKAPPPPPQVDVGIDKDDAGRTFSVGSLGTYTITATNVGGVDTTGPITVTDVLPAGLTFASASGTGWTCSNAAATITCTFGGTLAPSQSAPPITVKVNVLSAALPQVINPASVSTPNDVNPANDNDTETTPVVAAPFVDLAINKSDAGATFTVGQNGTYTLTVTNIGTGATTGPTTVIDTLPTGLGFVSAAGSGWDCTNALAVITCTRSGSIDAGDSAPAITVTVSVALSAVPNVVNPAKVTTTGDDNPANDQDTETTPVVSVLGEVIRPAALPKTGDDRTPILALLAMCLIGAGVAYSMDPKGLKALGR